MTSDTSYDDIRPYRDHEFSQVMDKMLDSPMTDFLIAAVFPESKLEDAKAQVRKIQTIGDFQKGIIYKAVMGLLAKTSDGFTKSGLENIDPKSAYLFVSNHRDIVLDPSLLNTAIVEKGFDTAEVAIGDNLLATPWVKDLARLNKSFIVKRNLSVRELVVSSKLLSNYISETIMQNNHSVWIAQREGRAKDGNDRTQPGLLNMLGMSAQGSIREHFCNLNIVPVSVSYEHDPCDVDKVRSLYAQKFFGGYTKEKGEDDLAMKKGILGYKGKIHIHFGKPMRPDIAALPDDLHKNEFIHQLSTIIDQQIIGNYKIQISNTIAYDLLTGNPIVSNAYSDQEKEKFVADMERKINTLAGEKDDLRAIYLNMYARPYQNKLEMFGTA